MDTNTSLMVTFSIIGLALFSYLAIAAWSNARRREREAYYKAEAIKKVAEMQGQAPEPVLQLLREALKPSADDIPSHWHHEVQREFYRNQTLQKIAESSGAGAETVREIMREEERQATRRRHAGMRLGGLIVGGVGVALFLFLQEIVPEVPVYWVGMIPIMVGAALLTYSFLLAPAAD